MNTFTVHPATSVPARSATPADGAWLARAIAYSATMVTVVPTIVCGRAKRHSTPGARTSAADLGRLAAAGRRLTGPRTLPIASGRIRGTMLEAYRRTGADPPFGDLRGWHGVGLEGYYWRFAHGPSGRAVAVILAVSRDAAGAPWGLVALAGHPGGFVSSAMVPTASAAPRGLRLELRDGDHTVVAAGADRLVVDLAPEARLDVALD